MTEAPVPLAVQQTGIPGLLVVDLPVHGDSRGWFKENWQREKMVALGLPDFRPVQNNISFNETRGVTRGIHAEPWDKFISVATGRVFGAWVDLRAGDTFGAVYTTELTPSRAIFVPRGVGNAFQTLEASTAYTYLVTDHWSADAQDEYTFLNLSDPDVAIPWPIPLDEAETSAKDKAHPFLADVAPMRAKRILVTGANGQLGTALRRALPAAGHSQVDFVDSTELDLTDAARVADFPWRRYATIINAAAYTAVDAAETAAGRRAAWAVNASGTANLARAAIAHNLTLVHVSTDYVFDGVEERHATDEGFSPLNVYGASKAAGDIAVGLVPRHYIVRTSWVIGDGPNFIRTMTRLASEGASPAVVDDQVGRLTLASDLADGILGLLGDRPPSGTYNVTSGGDPESWAEIARRVFAENGRDPDDVSPITTEDYAASHPGSAPRPRNSTLA